MDISTYPRSIPRSIGAQAPLATRMLHWVYGAVLGAVYGAGRSMHGSGVEPGQAHHA